MTRPALLALATGLLFGCADTNAPPPEPLELLLVVNRQGNSLTIVSVDEPHSPTFVPFRVPGATPTSVAAREGIAVVALGEADGLAVVDLVGRRLIHVIPLAEGSGATAAAMVSDSVAYVANSQFNTITRINVFTRETAEVLVGVFPQGFAVARGRLFVLNGNLDETGEPAGPSWLAVINPGTNAPAAGIDSIPLTGPGNAAFATVGGDGLLYVVNRGPTTTAEGRLSVVDPLERAEVASFAGLGLLPGDLATDGQSRVFVSSFTEGLLEFNTDSNAVVRGEGAGIAIPSNSGVAADSKGRVYAIEAGECVAGRRGVAHVLDEELEEIGRITLGRCSAGATVVRIGLEASDIL
jgi:DNA-binding beta-propeller fold protein YncE